MDDELATLANKIKTIEEKIETLEEHIETIRTGDDAAVEALGYGRRDEAKAVLVALINEKVELRKDLRSAKEQQGGAGTSKLPVHLELVMFPRESSCCMHLQTF
jgi:chromosome segregation ATPase